MRLPRFSGRFDLDGTPGAALQEIPASTPSRAAARWAVADRVLVADRQDLVDDLAV